MCPITGRRILRPVALPSSDRVYEKFAVEKRIKGITIERTAHPRIFFHVRYILCNLRIF